MVHRPASCYFNTKPKMNPGTEGNAAVAAGLTKQVKAVSRDCGGSFLQRRLRF